MDLESCRQEIDGIDGQLLALFRRRMDVVRQVAEYKAAHQLPIFHAERESRIIEHMTEQAGDECAEGARVVFTALMDVSKAYQHQILAHSGSHNPLGILLEDALAAPKHVPQEARVALSGVAGAYAHEAASQLFAHPDLMFVGCFEDVFDAVAGGAADYGVLPIENSSAGSVGEVYDLLKKHRLYICKSCKLPISHCLLTAGSVPLDGITDVYSHGQGLDQCSEFLRAHPGIRPHIYSNTAAAAQHVSQTQSPYAAAIASCACAELYGLHIAENGLQNAHENYTRFIVISRELVIPPGADKISLSLTLPHVTGSLYRLLTRFAMGRLNLTKLESRPLPETDFEFLFYFDFDGTVRDENVRNLLCALSDELGRFDFLGNYQ